MPLLYAMLFTMPGIPCIYYGGEWGISGVKENESDDALRPVLSEPEWNELTDLISSLAKLHKEQKALVYGDYKSIVLTNRQLIFQREYEGEKIWVSVNADEQAYQARLHGMENCEVTNLLSGEKLILNDSFTLPPSSFFVWKS